MVRDRIRMNRIKKQGDKEQKENLKNDNKDKIKD